MVQRTTRTRILVEKQKRARREFQPRWKLGIHCLLKHQIASQSIKSHRAKQKTISILTYFTIVAGMERLAVPVVSSTCSCSSDSNSTTIIMGDDTNVDCLTWRMDPDHSFSDWRIEIYVPSSAASTTVTAVTAASTAAVSVAGKNRSSGRLHGMYYVHKNILALGPKKSEYFEHLFRSTHFCESQEKVSRIELIELAAISFPIMLDYFYTFSEDFQVDHNNAAALYHLGEYFGVPSLCNLVDSFWQNPDLSSNQLGVLYEHAEIFGMEKLGNLVLQACCRCPTTISIESDLARHGGAKFWRALLRTNNGAPNADLCALIADYCLSEDADLTVYRQLREENIQLSVISNETALKFLRLEQRIDTVPFDGLQPIEFVGVRKECIRVLAESWPHLDETVLQESLTKLHPVVLTSILQTSVQNAKKDLVPDKIVVSDAGEPAVNGVYVRCDSLDDPAPKYILEDDREWNGELVDFTLHLCRMISTKLTWFISIADDDQPGTDRDIDFYCSAPRQMMTQMLPLTDWRVKQHGRAPVPSFKFVYDKH